MASGDPDNRTNLFRLQILIIDGSLLVLRNILDQTIAAQNNTLSISLKNEKLKITRLLVRKVITTVQFDLLFPVGGQDPTSSDMDITLIICLLANLKCFGLSKHFKWNATPDPSDLTVEADICRLRNFRNQISHISTTTEINSHEFATLWKEIEQILVRQSTPDLNIHQKIADFKSCPLDPVEDERIKEEIKKWVDYVDRLKQKVEDIQEVQKKVEDVEEDLTEFKRQFEDARENDTTQKKHFDNMTENVTEVTKELEDVKENLTKVMHDLVNLEENVTEMKKDLEEVKRRQQTDNNEHFPQTVEDKYQIRKKGNNEDVPQTVEDKYQIRKKEVKDGLIEFYKTRHSKVLLWPFFEEKDTPLMAFYIRPELNLIISGQTGNDEKIPLKSLTDMFKTGKQANREIYVIADAGLGKTSFSNYLAITWCQAHFPDEYMTQSFIKKDIECMHEFDFVFLILLKDSNDLCSIDNLIFEKVVSNLGLEETLSKDVLLKILKNEKCLVILDGLDEWTHPEKECYRSPRSIPHRNDREKCTVMTTTRPWKLGVLNLNMWQLGQKVELTKLCFDSAVTLVESTLQRLKSYLNKDALESDVTQFTETLNKRETDKLYFVPLLLMYTTCLWCEGVQIRDSKCDLYINIVELLLSRTIQIHGELQQSWELSSSDIPECFDEYDNCTKYYPLLLNLGKLAYYTLFNETKENTLVFDGSVARKYIAQDEMKFTLHSGMLSESISKTLTKKISKVSFSHKTVQAFFAAIFISSHCDAKETVLKKCRNVHDILDMSDICEFISEINADWMCETSNYLMSVINEDKITRDFRTCTGYGESLNNNPLFNIQKMFMSCLQEMPESENIQLCLQDFFIDENTMYSVQLQRLLKQNKTNIKSLYINMRFTFSTLRDLFSLTDLSHIQKLYYSGDTWKEAEINQILFPSLHTVTLLWGKWTNGEENLSENVARLQNLQYVYIFNFTLSHKILDTIFNFISGQKSMKEITLGELDCKDHGSHHCERLNLDLSKHSTLTKLDLMDLPRLQLNMTTPSLVDVTLRRFTLDKSSLLLSRDMLNIKHVLLWDLEMSEGSLQNFITLLKNLPQSVTVEMAYIKPEPEYDRVRKNIRRSQTFYVTQDDSWPRRYEFKK